MSEENQQNNEGKDQPAAADVSFEESLAQLEAIVAEMESSSTDLDTMVKSFEKGLALVKRCSDKLAAVERKVEELTRNADGMLATAPFDENS